MFLKSLVPVGLILSGVLACSSPGDGGGAGTGGSTGAARTTGIGGSTGAAGTGGNPSGGTAGGATGAAGTSGAGGGGSGGAGAGGGSGSGGAGGDASGSGGTGGAGGGGTRWIGTWACGPQLTETANNPPAPGLTNNTLRQIVFSSIGGSELRLRLSNEFGNGPVTVNAVHIALSTGGSAINASTDRALAFSGAASVSIPAGQAVFSDPLAFPLTPLTKVAITVVFGATPSGITGHPGSRTTSYLAAGNMVGAASLTGAAPVEHWYYIVGLDVMADAGTAAVVTLGDSITDGRGSTTDMDNRWPDDLSRRLQASAATANKVAVLNQGIGGNAVLSGGLGPTAVERFRRDVLQMRGVKWLIILEGVNDVGATASGATTATQLTSAFGQFADMAHAQGIKVYGATITPFNGNAYYTADHELARTTVNDWVRTSNKLDAVIDLDMAVRDPANTPRLLPAYDSGDGLHLNPAGYQKMADSINLSLFINP